MRTPNYVRELGFPDGVFCERLNGGTAERRNDGIIIRAVAKGALGGGGGTAPPKFEN